MSARNDPTNGRRVSGRVDLSNIDFACDDELAKYLRRVAEDAVEDALANDPTWMLVYPGNGRSRDLFITVGVPLGKYAGEAFGGGRPRDHDTIFRFNFSRLLEFQGSSELGDWDKARRSRYAECLRALADKIER